MNSRRWAAIGIAVAIFLVSAVTSISTSQTDSTDAFSVVESMYGGNTLQETVLEEGNGDKIVQIPISGQISMTSSSSLLAGSDGYNQDLIMESLEQVRDDNTVKAIILLINSPGGEVYPSAEVHDKLLQVKEERNIPVYTAMQSMAASGGYYIAAASDKIYAGEETITGSIGVISSGLNYSGLMEKLGITDQTVKSGANKDMSSSTRPETEEERKILQESIDRTYNRFVKVVAEGRNMSIDDVKKIADGRIYDGGQAVENGLVDGIAYPEEVLVQLRKDQNLSNASLIEYSASSSLSSFSSLLSSKVSNGATTSEMSALKELLEVERLGEIPAPMYLYGGDSGE